MTGGMEGVNARVRIAYGRDGEKRLVTPNLVDI